MEEAKVAAVTVCQIDYALEERQHHDRRKQDADITLAVERRQKDRRAPAEKQS